MSVGVPLRGDVRKVGDEPENVNMGATILMRLRNREISDMVVRTLSQGQPKPPERTVGPSNNCVLNRTLIPAPVGPEHHLIAELRRVIGDRVEHQEPLPTGSLEGFNLKGGCPTSSPNRSVRPTRPRAKTRTCRRDSPGNQGHRGRP